MSLKEGKTEVVMGVIFVVLGVLLLAVVIPTQIKYVDGAYPQPRFFPQVISSLLVVLGIALSAGGFVKKKKMTDEEQETYSFRFKEVRLVLFTMLVLVVYVALLSVIPYLPATMIALAVLMVAYGQRNKWKIIAVAILLPIIIYIGLTYGLKLRLP